MRSCVSSSQKHLTSFSCSFNTRHSNNIRLASKSTSALPQTRSSYGIFNMRYFGSRVRNKIDET